MAPSLGASLRAFWHDLTSNDRHASLASPYRTGSHMSLGQNRHSPLSSSAATAIDSRTDLNHDLEAGNGFVNGDANGSASPGSIIRRQSSGLDAKMDGVSTGGIQMQSFNDGLPPPPPVSHSWKRIDRWMEDNYEELFENLGPGATVNDINELEHELDCTLPNEVRDSLQVHDGQERGGLPTGAILGCMLLDCEEITQEWQNWRTVNEVYFGENRPFETPQAPIKAFAGSSSAPVASASQSGDPHWRQHLNEQQDSQPPNAIQKVYAHPSWIPLARDWGGNNICVDLSPGPAGKWGQVILMGRDYDCKYVISRSWAAFLATVADDLGTDKPYIDEDTKELKLREFRQAGVEPAYIDILRWRADQKYGRKGPKKRATRGNSSSSNGRGHQGNDASPYNGDDRGRSPQRLSNGKAPATNSPRAHVSSPLARVAEESALPTQSLVIDTSLIDASKSTDRLVSVDTPRAPGGTLFEKLVSVDSSRQGSVAEESTGRGSTANDAATAGADEMKDVQI